MKRVLLVFVLISAGIITSCKNETKSEENTTEVAQIEYQCPMKCEGEKTYADKDVKCPVCSMDLAVVDKSSDSHEGH